MGFLEVMWALAVFVPSLLYPAGWEMVKHEHFTGARISFWVGTVFLLGVELMWALYTNQPLLARLFISGIVGAIAIIGLTESLRYVSTAEANTVPPRNPPLDTTKHSNAAVGSATVSGINYGIVGGVVNIYHAPVTQTAEKVSREEVAKMGDAPPKPNVAVTNSPGSIIAPSGGYNAITNNNYGPVPRHLDSQWATSLKEQILRDVPRDKPITVVAIMGDGESIQFAMEILAYLKANGFKVTQDKNVDQALFTGPVKGQIVEPKGDGLQFIVGTNLP